MGSNGNKTSHGLMGLNQVPAESTKQKMTSNGPQGTVTTVKSLLSGIHWCQDFKKAYKNTHLLAKILLLVMLHVGSTLPSLQCRRFLVLNVWHYVNRVLKLPSSVECPWTPSVSGTSWTRSRLSCPYLSKMADSALASKMPKMPALQAR